MNRRIRSALRWLALASLTLGMLACQSETTDDPAKDIDVVETADTDAGGDDTADSVAPPAPALGICDYVNPFSKGDECKEYRGEAWSVESATADCDAVLLGTAGTFTPDATCGYEDELGRCDVDESDGLAYVLVSQGADSGLCGAAQTGCEVFGGGTFAAGETCEGEIGPPPTGGNYGEVPFVQPYQVCKDPLPGEPAGLSADGKVCTWTLISGCTEPGRHFEDYASCEDVRTQRPYYGSPDPANTPDDDPRLSDQAYLTELEWARGQVQAAACVCCHAEPLAPDGPSWWSIDAKPIWIDSVRDSGLAMMAGLAGSEALGAYPAADNNGFDRTALGLPTTDIERMRAFLMGEWARRGYTPEQGAEYEEFGGPIVDQLRYTPEACEDGEGVDDAGVMSWKGGDARYAYVLDADAVSPGVPPNLDEPEGTLWLVDVPTDGEPFASGIGYGVTQGALRQRIPAAGSPPALQAGQDYYVYALKDIGFPITRCLFTYPAK